MFTIGPIIRFLCHFTSRFETKGFSPFGEKQNPYFQLLSSKIPKSPFFPKIKYSFPSQISLSFFHIDTNNDDDLFCTHRNDRLAKSPDEKSQRKILKSKNKSFFRLSVYNSKNNTKVSPYRFLNSIKLVNVNKNTA